MEDHKTVMLPYGDMPQQWRQVKLPFNMTWPDVVITPQDVTPLQAPEKVLTWLLDGVGSDEELLRIFHAAKALRHKTAGGSFGAEACWQQAMIWERG